MSLYDINGLKTAKMPTGVGVLSAITADGCDGRVLWRALVGGLDSSFDGITPIGDVADGLQTHEVSAEDMPTSAVWGGFDRRRDGMAGSAIANTADNIGIRSTRVRLDDSISFEMGASAETFNNTLYGLESTAHGCQSRRERLIRRHRH